jgi:hypothetical protein
MYLSRKDACFRAQRNATALNASAMMEVVNRALIGSGGLRRRRLVVFPETQSSQCGAAEARFAL